MRRACIAVALCAVAISAIPASAEALAPATLSPAAETLSSCVQRNGQLSVLMLIDESGSLATTDPYNQRVDGIRAALTGLADLSGATVGDAQPQVSVLMAGFYGRAHPDPEDEVADVWKPVTGDNIDELIDEAGRYETLNRGRATDYVTALVTARKLLAARAAEQTAEGGAASCQALIWFTDGRYALPQRVGKSGIGMPREVFYAPGIRLDRRGAGERAVAVGKRRMCAPEGLMDRLQRDGVVRFTVALSTDLSPQDAAFLDAATTGAAGAERCGAHLSPLSGEYLTARDGDRLFFAFANLLGSAPPIQVDPICPERVCVRGVTTFETVPGLTRFLIRGAGAGGSEDETEEPLEVQLEGPGGEAIALRPDGPDELSLAGTTIVQRWVSDRAVEVQGDFAPGSRDWLGRWSYTFVEPSAAADASAGPGYSTVQLFADLEPAMTGSPALIRGVPTELEFELRQGSDPERRVSAGPLVRSARLVASIDDPVAGTSIKVPVTGPQADGTFSAKVTVPPGSTAGSVYLGLTASFSTAGGTPIAPQFRSFDVPVRFPPGQGFPTVSPTALELPALRGLGEVKGELTVRGNPVSSGCVWLEQPQVDAPGAAGEVTATISPRSGSPSRCLPLGKGEERVFTVTLTPASQARGTVSAPVRVHLRSDLVDDEQVVSVPATFAMAPAPNDVARIVLLVLLVLVGALLPLLLLHLLNRQGARFTAPNRLRAVELPVEMSRGGRLRRRGEEAAPVDLGRGESLHRHGSKPRRELKVGGVTFEAVASGSLKDRTLELFKGPYGVARAGGKRLLAGASQPLRCWHGGTAQEVPLALSGTWVFRFDALHAAEPDPEPDPHAEPVGSASAEEGLFFVDPARPQPASQVEAPRGRREPEIEGQLILLTYDGPPVDQADVLFAAAEEALRDADELWEQARPEPEEPAGPPPEDEGRERSPEPAAPPPPESPADWKQPQPWSSGPAPERPRPSGRDGDDKNFF